MSAAGSIILTLALLIIVMIGLPIGGVILYQVAQDRQERRKLDKAKAQAEVYAALQGAQRPPTAARPRALPSQGQQPIIIVGGGQQAPGDGQWRVM
jgi:hypothetical protein